MVLTREFDDNTLLQVLFGPQNINLERIERTLGVQVNTRGNAITVSGPAGLIYVAGAALDALYERLRRGQSVDLADVDAVVCLSRHGMLGPEPEEALILRTRRRSVMPRSIMQAEYLRAMRSHELVFGLGPAGTGKTYLAVAMGVSMMLRGQVDRLVLSRPAVEAGERLGFLPGGICVKRSIPVSAPSMMPCTTCCRAIR